MSKKTQFQTPLTNAEYFKKNEQQMQRLYLQSPQRLASIKIALQRLKQKNQKYIQHFELNKNWRKIYNGLLAFNKHQQLPKLIDLKLCDALSQEKSFFNPYNKAPVSICYNKINNLEKFQQQALYNLILHYDNQIKPDINWNSVEPTLKSTIRALNISGICQRNDKICFENECKKRVLDKERFVGLKVDFNKIYEQAISDFQPISQVLFH